LRGTDIDAADMGVIHYYIMTGKVWNLEKKLVSNVYD